MKCDMCGVTMKLNVIIWKIYGWHYVILSCIIGKLLLYWKWETTNEEALQWNHMCMSMEICNDGDRGNGRGKYCWLCNIEEEEETVGVYACYWLNHSYSMYVYCVKAYILWKWKGIKWYYQLMAWWRLLKQWKTLFNNSIIILKVWRKWKKSP